MWVLYVYEEHVIENVKGDDIFFDKKRCNSVFMW